MFHSRKNPREVTLGHLLAHVCRLVGGRRRMKLEKIGLYHGQGMILFQLWHQDGIPQRILAQALHITPPTASSTLKRMERDGWIIRKRDETDQRIVRVYLTEKSKRLRKEARISFDELDSELAEILSEEEQVDFRQTLLKVHRYMVNLYRQDGDDTSGTEDFSKHKEI